MQPLLNAINHTVTKSFIAFNYEPNIGITMPRKNEFSHLNVPILKVKGKDESHYLVFRDAKDFVKVEAETITEALAKSGIEKPYKVVHTVFDLNKVMDESMLLRENTDATTPSDQPPSSET